MQNPQASCRNARGLLLHIHNGTLKSYRFSSLMVFNRIVGALFPFYLVSLKDDLNEGFPRLGVVLKHLEVESKRQERNNYKYNQAVVND